MNNQRFQIDSSRFGDFNTGVREGNLRYNCVNHFALRDEKRPCLIRQRNCKR